MNKTFAISIAVIAITLIYTFTFLGRKQNTTQETSDVSGIDTAQITYDHIPADTIEVVNFFWDSTMCFMPDSGTIYKKNT